MNAVLVQKNKCQSHLTLSAVVAGINAQRSAELRLLTSQGWIAIGSIPIPHNHPVPAVGAVVAIQHRPAAPESKALCQPRYLGQRRDMEPHECLMAQLTHRMTWRPHE